jgi:OOP family OmpA-OmpF porin
VVDDAGCPIDTDGDGVFDGIDTCANTPVGVIVNGYGCPMDSDDDGVWDGWDKCPGTPPGLDVDAVGCPLDSDGDGVADYMDKCPETPKGATVDAEGCPTDGDGDGVFDGIDKCAETPAGVVVDAWGCPPFVEQVTLTESSTYASGSYQLTEKTRTELDKFALGVLAYPDSRINISGYADPTGPAEFNLTLSVNRAQAVATYLVSKGVAEARMTVKGFGEDPKYFVADNDTAEGRQKNRRVDILVVPE